MYLFKETPFSSHAIIVNLVRLNFIKGTILDIGCASGYIGRQLQSSDYLLYGVDSDRRSLEEAKKYYKDVWLSDVELHIPNFKVKFDLLIFADILEHLKKPEGVLGKLLRFGNEQALVIISVPNVANIAVRLLLLFGFFNYTDKGILDKTHLRFFTLSTLLNLIDDNDLEILKIKFSALPFFEVFPLARRGKPFYLLNIIAYILANFWGRMFAYQFVVLARRKSGRIS